jgi:SAM-dependent methyltransferase
VTVTTTPYATLAGVYEFITPDGSLTPEGSSAGFAGLLEPGARVLDCACGIGLLAAGLAARGFAVSASDASPEMVARTRALGVDARVCRWEDLSGGPYDAVLCVGNSLAHAPDRRAALSGMARVLAPGGALAVTSRNWERERAAGSRLEVDDRLVERDGRRALVIRAWTVPEAWDATHAMDLAVAVLGEGGALSTARERLTFWPFTPAMLEADLRAVGLAQESSTYMPDAERYDVFARICEQPDQVARKSGAVG